MRKNAMSIFVLILFLNLIGCSHKESGLNQVTKEVEKNGGSIMTVKGFEVKEIDLLPDPLGQNRDSIIYLFTDKIGKLDQSKKSNSNDIKILYGPYKGTDIFKITQSEVEVLNEDDMNKKVINGIEMYYKTINNRIIIFVRSNGISYTYEAKITEKYSETKHFDLLYAAISS
ncbi:hypothetical protein AMQ84_02715 [Paenibacillus riograndensis]|uniref:Uncharacterized protein n=1 Tax=Paenibacillus riograndensis TaxID=483937 RepID=A0A132UBG8_9BACL|nr:hypothetical protein [Paenibacillus riograndensis]KWX80693.1 hypothetical protein AMQ84_02715 [Paenibacillus riograndensis]